MNHALPAARPVHTALFCALLFGGTLAVQAMSALATPADPWAGLARSSERARAAVEALSPCERALEEANAVRLVGTGPRSPVVEAQRACAGSMMAVEVAGLAETCAAAAAAAAQAAADLARGADAGKAIVRYRSQRARCLSDAVA